MLSAPTAQPSHRPALPQHSPPTAQLSYRACVAWRGVACRDVACVCACMRMRVCVRVCVHSFFRLCVCLWRVCAYYYVRACVLSLACGWVNMCVRVRVRVRVRVCVRARTQASAVGRALYSHEMLQENLDRTYHFVDRTHQHLRRRSTSSDGRSSNHKAKMMPVSCHSFFHQFSSVQLASSSPSSSSHSVRSIFGIGAFDNSKEGASHLVPTLNHLNWRWGKGGSSRASGNGEGPITKSGESIQRVEEECSAMSVARDVEGMATELTVEVVEEEEEVVKPKGSHSAALIAVELIAKLKAAAKHREYSRSEEMSAIRIQRLRRGVNA